MFPLARARRSGLLILLVVAALVLATTDCLGACGPVRVVDGDTVVQAGERIRLLGIDSPERGRPWAAAATARLRDLASSGLCCDAVARDRYGRRVAVCRAGGGDVGQILVREGLARAAPRFSRRYLPDERSARLDRLGLWSGRRAARTE